MSQMNQDTKQVDTSSFVDIANVYMNQPTLNVGMIGHVSHGKSTLVEALSGVKTAKHEEELSKNMTMRLGFANVKIWMCETCPKPRCYSATGAKAKTSSCAFCSSELKLVRHISFVDCPGHELLMNTMLNGSAVMDAALLLVAANASCPQRQTQEHLRALELKGLKSFCVIQNKVDLVDKKAAQENFLRIREYAKSKAQSLLSAPTIPVSAQHRLNLEYVCQYLANLPVPNRDYGDPLMLVIRSFDVNKPGQEIDDLQGGVAGGSLIRGKLCVDQRVEIRPGLVFSKPDGTTSCKPLFTKVVSISSEQTKLNFAIPGGLIGIGTTLDSTLTKSDRLVGQMIGLPGKMPPVFQSIVISYERIPEIGGEDEDSALPNPSEAPNSSSSQPQPKKKGKQSQPQKLKKETPVDTTSLQKGMDLRVNINSLTSTGKVVAVHEDKGVKFAKIKLGLPCCAEVSQKITFSLMTNGKWKIIGVGSIMKESQPLKCE